METRSCFIHGDYTGKDECPDCKSIGRPEPTLARRLGWMADAIVSVKVGPKSRFFSRERVDEIVLLLREAEKHVLDAKQDRRCDGRYPVPQTSPPRDEPFPVTYRCDMPKGHDGPHGPEF